MKKNNILKGIVPYLFLFAIIALLLYFVGEGNKEVHELSYDKFKKEIEKGSVTELVIVPKTSEAIYEFTGKLKKYEENESFYVKAPFSDKTLETVISGDVNYKIVAEADPNGGAWLTIILNLLPLVLLIGFAIFLFTRQVGGSGKSSMDFGKSKARLNQDRDKTTFNKVAGLVEEKEEVAELIDFLKNPKKFQKMGARIPKGVLLVGPPGTGKTLLAKAVAGEANVPFYFISGSDFVELFVGIGASRVRDMFKQAKNNAPCLIFIDEIDAVGRQRGTGLGGGHDEREQTLNQLLTEMDGFGANEGIIIIAATNRPDVLDPALLRPGRFDRQITVNLPDKNEREAILNVHAANKKLAPNIKLSTIASRTPGYSGADLENLLNEAALLAVRADKDMITMTEIDEAADRVLMGPAKVTRKYNDKEKKYISYHEAGHAVIGLKLKDAEEVQKITIIPRGMAGGYTMLLPKEENIAIMTKAEILDRITGLLGGRATEDLFLKDVTTGASDDFRKATQLARSMVTEYGMSDLGPMQFEQQTGDVFLGRDYAKHKNFSDQVALEIDKEVRKIIDQCYENAKKIINENKDLIFLISDALIEHEILTKEQIDYLVKHKKMPVEKNLEEYTLEELKEMAKEKGLTGYSKMKKEELLEELKK